MARVGSFRRGKVCQNRGGITGPREKRTRRLRDIDFIALATNFARVGFFHTKKPRFCAVLSPRSSDDFQKSRPSLMEVGGFQQIENGAEIPFFPRSGVSHKRSDFGLLSRYYFTKRSRSAKRSAERRVRDDRDREKVCNS